MVSKISSKKIIRRKSLKKSSKKGGASKKRSSKKNSKRSSRRVNRGGASPRSPAVGVPVSPQNLSTGYPVTRNIPQPSLEEPEELKHNKYSFTHGQEHFQVKQVARTLDERTRFPGKKLYELAWTDDEKFLEAYRNTAKTYGEAKDSHGVNRLYNIKTCVFYDANILGQTENGDLYIEFVNLGNVVCRQSLGFYVFLEFARFIEKDLIPYATWLQEATKNTKEYKTFARKETFTQQQSLKKSMIEDVYIYNVGKILGIKRKTANKCMSKSNPCVIGLDIQGKIYLCGAICGGDEKTRHNKLFDVSKIVEDTTKSKFIIEALQNDKKNILEIHSAKQNDSPKLEKMNEIRNKLQNAGFIIESR